MTKLSILLLILLLSVNICLVASAHDWYVSHDFVATTFHFLGGLFVALLIHSFYNNQFTKVSQPVRLYFLVGMVLIVGVTWEFVEFSVTQITFLHYHHIWYKYGPFIGDLQDTLSDLSMDMLGGIITGLLLYKSKSSSKV